MKQFDKHVGVLRIPLVRQIKGIIITTVGSLYIIIDMTPNLFRSSLSTTRKEKLHSR